MNARWKHFVALGALLAVLAFLLVTGMVWVTQTLPQQMPDGETKVVVRDFAPPLGQSPWRRTVEEPRPIYIPLAQNPWRYRATRPRAVMVEPGGLPWGRDIDTPVRIIVAPATLPWKS